MYLDGMQISVDCSDETPIVTRNSASYHKPSRYVKGLHCIMLLGAIAPQLITHVVTLVSEQIIDSPGCGTVGTRNLGEKMLSQLPPTL